MNSPSPTATLVSALLEHAAKTPDKLFAHLCMRDGDVGLSYGDLLERALRFAALYQQNGATPGDIVLIFLKTQADMFPAFFGAMLIGAIPSYMPCPSAKQDADRYWQNHRVLFDRTQPSIIVTDADTATQMARNGLDGDGTTLLHFDQIGEPLPLASVRIPSGSDIALLQHSSGTTGLKKGVLLSYAAIQTQISAYTKALRASPDDVIVSWLPVYHDMGLVACTLLPLTIGQTIILLDPFEWSSDPISLFHRLTEHKGTLVWLPNFAFEHLVRSIDEADESFDLSSVRALINCSEPCKPETFTRFAQRFTAHGGSVARLQVCYAMAETVFAVTQTELGAPVKTVTVSDAGLREDKRARPAQPGETAIALLSTGQPVDGMQLRIDGAGVGEEGVVGEVIISGSSLFDGYYQLPDVTQQRLIDRRYYTRDLGFVLDGELYILGRMDDLIIVHGKNFYAHEIEMAVSKVRGIKPGRAVAFGIENALVGSQDLVVVAEQADDATNLPEIKRDIKEALFQEIGIAIREAMLVPSGWLVKTSSGKISRESNKAKYLQEKSAGKARGVVA